MDYKEEFDRLLDTAKQAANSSFKSQAANAVLEEAIEYYENLENPEERFKVMENKTDNLDQ